MDDLQLDLGCIVARLIQVQNEGGFSQANPVVVDRILTCDLPRLQGHLSAEARALVDEVFDDVTRGIPRPVPFVVGQVDAEQVDAEQPATPGEIAYTAYAKSVGWVSVRGEQLPAWPRLDWRVRDAWSKAAQAVHAAG